jgi:hypothetical protein
MARRGNAYNGHGRGIANDGQPYENSYAWVMKLADGKVIDGTAFYDSISFNDLWAPRPARVRPGIQVPLYAGRGRLLRGS